MSDSIEEKFIKVVMREVLEKSGGFYTVILPIESSSRYDGYVLAPSVNIESLIESSFSDYYNNDSAEAEKDFIKLVIADLQKFLVDTEQE